MRTAGFFNPLVAREASFFVTGDSDSGGHSRRVLCMDADGEAEQ